MASVDEVLAAMETPEEAERVILTIDEDLRIVTIPGIALVIGAEGDRDVNRIWFKMDRKYRGTDLEGFTPRVNYNSAAGNAYFYMPTDKTVDEKSILFSWLVGRGAAEKKGTVEFSICMQLLKGDVTLKEFNTTTATMQCLQSIHDENAEKEASSEAYSAVLGKATCGMAVLGMEA